MRSIPPSSEGRRGGGAVPADNPGLRLPKAVAFTLPVFIPLPHLGPKFDM